MSGQGKSGKGQGKIFFGKVRENEMLQLVKDCSVVLGKDVIDSLQGFFSVQLCTDCAVVKKFVQL